MGNSATKVGVGGSCCVSDCDSVLGALLVLGGGLRRGFTTPPAAASFCGDVTGTTGGGVMTGALMTGGADSSDRCEEVGEEEEPWWPLSEGLKAVVEFVLSSISPQYSSNF